MNIKTSTLQKYLDIFGESEVIAAVSAVDGKKTPSNIIGITNPVMRFLKNTTQIKAGKIYIRSNIRVPPGDYAYFRMVSALLSDLNKEIASNDSYRRQLAQKILHHQSGPMLSAMNEILVAGYYKYLDIKVSLNSSAQPGAADIDLVDLPFATDTKIFPNKRLLLEAIVDDSAQYIVDVAKLIRNQGLLLSIFNPDKKKIQRSLKDLKKVFDDPAAGRYSDDTLHATIMENDYPGADFHFSVQPNNVNMFFQASWDMAPSIEELKTSIEKAVKQAKVLSKQAIPWIMVPRDASRNGIEVQVLRFEGKFHQYVYEHDDIFMMPVYSLEFEGNKFSLIMDVFQTGSNTLKVNSDTFMAFIKGLVSRSELYV